MVATSSKVQSSQKTILCLLVQEPCAGTIPSASYTKQRNVWPIYGSLRYIAKLQTIFELGSIENSSRNL